MKQLKKKNKKIWVSKAYSNPDSEGKFISLLTKENIEYIKEKLFYSGDIRERNIFFNDCQGVLIYIDTLADKNLISKFIIKPLEQAENGCIEHIITVANIEIEKNLDKAINMLLQGKCLLFFEGLAKTYISDVGLLIKRGLQEPDNERIIQGAHDGFVDNLSTNLYLIRNRIENSSLVVKYFSLGKKNKTQIALVYMHNLISTSLINEVLQRLQSVDTDCVYSSGSLIEYLEDNLYSPFPQLLFTERPDRIVSSLMEGRFVILTNGNSNAITAPVSFFSFYQSPDDYNSRWMIGSFARLIRIFSFLVAVMLPSIYISIISFHPEIIPIELIYSIKSSIEKVPIPPLIEAFLMELTLELIKEAGTRLPSRIGQTIGIVGGLVIGDAIVRTGLASLPMIIIVSITALASFAIPSSEMSLTIRFLKFPLMIAASIFGFIGVVVGVFLIFVHLIKLKPFGVSYSSPSVPFTIKELRAFIRLPFSYLKKTNKNSR